MERMPSIEQPKREIIADPEQLRQIMRQFWHREPANLDELKKELESGREDHITELLRLGYAMEALILRTAKEKEEPLPADKNSFLFASQNETKRELAAKAAGEAGMFIQETLFSPSDKEEEIEHQIIKQLIREARQAHRHPRYHIPTVKEFSPDYFAVDVARAKVSKMRETFKNQVIIGGDIVVLRGKQILEKPKSREEAIQILKNISGKEVKISLAVVLLTPTSFGKTILLSGGAYLTIKLRQFSEAEAERHFDQFGEKHSNVVGALDYADPLTQRLISDAPVKIEVPGLRKVGEAPQRILVSSRILPQLKDYFMGVPLELIEEMLKWTKSLR